MIRRFAVALAVVMIALGALVGWALDRPDTPPVLVHLSPRTVVVHRGALQGLSPIAPLRSGGG